MASWGPESWENDRGAERWDHWCGQLIRAIEKELDCEGHPESILVDLDLLLRMVEMGHVSCPRPERVRGWREAFVILWHVVWEDASDELREASWAVVQVTFDRILKRSYLDDMRRGERVLDAPQPNTETVTLEYLVVTSEMD